ncbi:MAG: polyprenyl synthetase family protein [Candidatus Manganitrophaceae bacterium]|nr:MAG: polyprenyl synthetase family protein [Candidatus Manganitrophaceae bacterium]
MDKETLKGYLRERQAEVDRLLQSYLPSAKCPPALIHEAMRYSLFAGGKRLRPILCLAAAESVGGRRETVLPYAAAIELIHTYSLIHDDLPAMDNDDYRRGKLTNHKMFGESTAILAGDALLTAAFTLIAEKGVTGSISHKKILSVMLELGSAAGSTGMVGGQLVDIQSEGKKSIDLEQLHYIHTHKTGALIRASVRIGGLLGGASPKKLSSLTRYGEKVGLAFQIADDVLDIEGEEKDLGKSVGQDEAKEKWTYPRLIGLERSKKEAQVLVEEAVAELNGFGPEAKALRSLALYMVERKK